MLGKKRGQVVIFIALGIILVVILALAIGFRSDITKIVTQSKSATQATFTTQVDEVQKHIEQCLLTSLRQAIPILAGKNTKDYDSDLAEETRLRAGLCLNLETFRNLELKKLAEPKLQIQRNTENTQVTATMELPISIQSGTDTQQLNEFVAQESLRKQSCVLKEMLDNSCKAKQDLTVGIFVFRQGQEVKMGGECLAC